MFKNVSNQVTDYNIKKINHKSIFKTFSNDDNYYYCDLNIAKNFNYKILYFSSKIYLIPKILVLYLFKNFPKDIVRNILNNILKDSNYINLLSNLNKNLNYYTSSYVYLQDEEKKYKISINSNTSTVSLQLSLKNYFYKNIIDEINFYLLTNFIINYDLDDDNKKYLENITFHIKKKYENILYL